MAEVIIRGGTILTIDPAHRIATGDVASIDDRLVHIGGDYVPQTDDFDIIDASGCVVMPGLVQSHTHMCQTLARGHADDLELLDWLQQVVWPYEAALRADDVTVAAKLACIELLCGGTTAILDMGTVHHTDSLFEVARDAGIRATIGKAMMDADNSAVPPGLRETTEDSLAESTRLCEQWHGRNGGRLQYAYAPRFVLSCTDELLAETVRRARKSGARIHTHASENRDEIATVKKLRGRDNIEHLHHLGMTGQDVCLAHCVWLSNAERDILRDTGTHVLHCPSSNLKLASGIAEIPELRAHGIKVSLGADGAPCNNNLDGFLEMRLAALIHKPRCGARAMRAPDVLRLATLGGADALGLADQIGSLEIGKKADVIVVDVEAPHIAPAANPMSAIVYAARSTDVRSVVVDGRLIVRDRELMTLDVAQTLRDARDKSRSIFARIATGSPTILGS